MFYCNNVQPSVPAQQYPVFVFIATNDRRTDVSLCLQERIAKAHGSQCGFCTPGMVMSVYSLLRNKPQPTMEDITQALAGVFPSSAER